MSTWLSTRYRKHFKLKAQGFVEYYFFYGCMGNSSPLLGQITMIDDTLSCFLKFMVAHSNLYSTPFTMIVLSNNNDNNRNKVFIPNCFVLLYKVHGWPF